MTRSEIRARALLQAGEQESALGDMAEVVNQYIFEGQQAMYPGGVCQKLQVTVSDGEGALGEGVLDIVRVCNAEGREATCYVLGEGRLKGLPDGTYQVTALCEPAKMENDAAECALPESVQGALADYTTWRLLSNGGRVQQARGDLYRQRFLMEKQQAERRQEMRMGARRRVNRYG